MAGRGVSSFVAACGVMRMHKRGLVIIGGGPAGMAAAVAAKKAGAEDILLIEREKQPGGILKQCIHNGFGLHLLRRDLTGPEYAAHHLAGVQEAGIQVLTDTMVVRLESDRRLTLSSPAGVQEIQAEAIILAMGCRERPAGAVMLPGSRPAGVLTAGVAQNYVNLQNKMVGRRIVIRGSGDIGLIMARRLTLEGAQVLCVVERKDYSSGLTRNLVQCLDDFNIPIKYRHVVAAVHGKERVEAVTLAKVDEAGRPLPGSQRVLPCDTLILSLGLIPENELSRQAGVQLDPSTGGAIVGPDLQTTVPGIFACGNVLHVHDLVDYVSQEAALAGQAAAGYLSRGMVAAAALEEVSTVAGTGVKYVLPHRLRAGEAARIFLRVTSPGRQRLVRLSCGSQVKEYKLPRLTPSEMLRLMAPAQLTAGGGGRVLEVTVE